MTDAPDHDDGLSEETRMLIAKVREQAATVPSGAGLAELAAAALSASGKGMSANEIQHLATDAIDQANQVSYLLGRLAGLLGEGAEGDRG